MPGPEEATAQVYGIQPDRFTDVLEAEEPRPVGVADVGQGHLPRPLVGRPPGSSPIGGALTIVEYRLEDRHHQPPLGLADAFPCFLQVLDR